MAGSIFARELVAARPARIRFALARVEDDAGLRRLLRTTPMHGAIRLTFEREPDYFRGCGIGGAVDQTIVAFENNRLVCMGRCSVRERFINGRSHRVGYLGELRLDASAQGRFDILRRGYQFFRQLHAGNPPAAWLTSVASDNHRSIRFLERNLRGMPRYDLLDGFVTLLLSVPGSSSSAKRLASRAETSLRARGMHVEKGAPELAGWMARQLNDHGGRFHFSTEWTAEKIQSLENWGLPLGDWQCVLRGRELLACAALWDQRGFRQTVFRGFSTTLRMVRPFVNLAAFAFGVAGIPSVHSILAHGFLSPFAVGAGQEDLLLPLLQLSLSQAHRRGLDFLTLGFSSTDPVLAMVKSRFPNREYHSRLYHVSWPEDGAGIAFDGRPVFPEVALL